MDTRYPSMVRLAPLATQLLAISLVAAPLLKTAANASPQHHSYSSNNDSDARWREAWKQHWRATHPANGEEKKIKKEAGKQVPPVAVATLPLPQTGTPPTAPSATPPVTAQTSNPASTPAQAQSAASAPAPTAAATPKTGHQTPNVAPAPKPVAALKTAASSAVPSPNTASFAGLTKPDGAAPGAPGTLSTNALHTQDNPTAAIGDSGRMLFYLVPMLLVTVGGLRLLRGYHDKHGQLPGALRAFAFAAGGRDRSRDDLLAVLNGGRTAKAPTKKGFFAALLGGHNLNLARQKAGGSIRVLESVPLGGNALHLVSVRGRTLLLGAGGAGINLLTEIGDRPPPTGNGGDFSALLRNAVEDMDELDLSHDETPGEALVGALDGAMHETSGSLAERVRRLRTVSEAQAQLGSED